MHRGREIWELLRDTYRECRRNKVARLAAALAYYAMFSLAPLILVVILMAGSTYGEAIAERAVLFQLDAVIGHGGAQAVQTLLTTIRPWRADPVTADRC